MHFLTTDVKYADIFLIFACFIPIFIPLLH